MANKKDLNPKTIVTLLISFIVIFTLFSAFIPEIENAGDTLNESVNVGNTTDVPLTGFFVTGGLIFILIMAGLLWAVYQKTKRFR